MAKIDIPNLTPLAVALGEVFNMTGFCIKQRYVSIKTTMIESTTNVGISSALSSDMYRLRRFSASTLVVGVGSALSSDMYRLRRCTGMTHQCFLGFCIKQRYVSIKTQTWTVRSRVNGFCIKQRYVSIKTIYSVVAVSLDCSALSSDMYRLRLTGYIGYVTPVACSALSSDMYRLRRFGVLFAVFTSGSALSSDMYRLRRVTVFTDHFIHQGSALSSDMYRLRQLCVMELFPESFEFCIKQRYVSIKTPELALYEHRQWFCIKQRYVSIKTNFFITRTKQIVVLH